MARVVLGEVARIKGELLIQMNDCLSTFRRKTEPGLQTNFQVFTRSSLLDAYQACLSGPKYRFLLPYLLDPLCPLP